MPMPALDMCVCWMHETYFKTRKSNTVERKVKNDELVFCQRNVKPFQRTFEK